MTYSSLRLEILVCAMIANLCPLLATPAQTDASSGTTAPEFLERARASIVVLTGEDKAGLPIAPGLGFWIGRDLIATDIRVVRDAVRLRVSVPGQESIPLELVSRDSHRFAAILTATRIQGSPLLLGDSDKVGAKDKVYLVSGPDANVAESEGAVKKIIAFNEGRYFQMTTPRARISRGAPILNAKGEVIGIAGESPEGQGPGFTIPSAYLTTLLRYRNMETPSGGIGTGGARAPGVGPGQGTNVPGGNTQPGARERIPLAGTPVDTRPVVLNNAQPRYTEEARRSQTQGMVNMRILVSEEGRVTETRVTKGLPDGLVEQAIAAAFQMRFKPATRSGEAVSYWLTIFVEFNLR